MVGHIRTGVDPGWSKNMSMRRSFIEITNNKTNQPISSNSHPSATSYKAIHSLKMRGLGVGLQNEWEHHIIWTKYEAVHLNQIGRP